LGQLYKSGNPYWVLESIFEIIIFSYGVQHFHTIANSPRLECCFEDFNAKVGLHNVVFVVEKVEFCLKSVLIGSKDLKTKEADSIIVVKKAQAHVSIEAMDLKSL